MNSKLMSLTLAVMMPAANLAAPVCVYADSIETENYSEKGVSLTALAGMPLYEADGESSIYVGWDSDPVSIFFSCYSKDQLSEKYKTLEDFTSDNLVGGVSASTNGRILYDVNDSGYYIDYEDADGMYIYDVFTETENYFWIGLFICDESDREIYADAFGDWGNTIEIDESEVVSSFILDSLQPIFDYTNELASGESSEDENPEEASDNIETDSAKSVQCTLDKAAAAGWHRSDEQTESSASLERVFHGVSTTDNGENFQDAWMDLFILDNGDALIRLSDDGEKFFSLNQDVDILVGEEVSACLYFEEIVTWKNGDYYFEIKHDSQLANWLVTDLRMVAGEVVFGIQIEDEIYSFYLDHHDDVFRTMYDEIKVKG